MTPADFQSFYCLTCVSRHWGIWAQFGAVALRNMMYREFVSRLAGTAPSHPDLAAAGLDVTLALDIINQRYIHP